MIKRHLENICFHDDFGRQMRFISGPRQVGKTTLARNFLAQKNARHLYFNWDLRQIRDKYIQDPYFFETDIYDFKAPKGPAWICLDEIHKMPKWKNILKDYFDKFEKEARFVITGSARLDWFRRSGDALTGRYFTFRLHPLVLSELTGRPVPGIGPADPALVFIDKQISRSEYNQDLTDQLLDFSGFPEPLTKASARFFKRWQTDMVDQVIREDIRDLTRIPEVENIAVMIQLLPSRVGAPLSLNAVREDMNVSYTAVRSALRAMRLTFVVFLVPPFSRNVARALTKESKCYFMDWTRCENTAARFENYIAVELKSLLGLWNDSGIADFELTYVRTRDGRETDFLIVKNDQPWCLFEVKLRDGPVSGHHHRHAEALGGIPVVQLTHESKILKKTGSSVFRISASRFF
jgi:predicted AAA+ superfamily ATPase